MPPRRPRPAPALGWDELRLVLALSRRGRLSDAARDLGVDATTVGRRLAALEARLGAPAFDRRPDGLVATAWIRDAAPELEAMEAAALAAERKLAAARAPARGKVTIAASESFAMHFLAAELEAIRREVPGVELELVASHALSDLRRREADVALRFVRPTSTELHARRLGSLRWSLYGSPGYLRAHGRPDPETGLAGHRVIRWGGPPLRPAVSAWLEAHAHRAEPVISTAALHVMFELCAHGVGLAALPGSLALGRGGLERAIDHAIDESELWLVLHRDARRGAQVRAVAAALGARMEALRSRLRAI